MEEKIGVIVASSLRELLQRVNSNELTKENIIQIIKDTPNWYLIYQKNA